MHRPEPGELYLHFKGNLYQIITVARHSETMEELVIYQALYGDYRTYARPLAMFVSEVDHQKYKDINATYRFTKIERSSLLHEYSEHDEIKEAGQQKEVGQQKEAWIQKEEKIQKEESKLQEDTTGMINVDLLEFLDARDYGEKLEVLYRIRKQLTERVMTDIELSLDLPVGKGSLEDRIAIVRSNLQTLERFETRRLR